MTPATRSPGTYRAKPARPSATARNSPSRNAPARQAPPGHAKADFAKADLAKPDFDKKSPAAARPEPKILFQKFFKSIGPRTYAAQLKELPNGNHLLVLTEGKRDPETGDVRKTRLFIYGEDLTAFFRLLHETAAFIRANPVPEEIRAKRDRFWARKAKAAASA